MVFDFYAYWNGEEVATLFSSVVGLFGAFSYKTLLGVTVLGGLIAATAFAAIRYRGMEVIQWFMAAIFVYCVAYLPKATVVVIDERVAFTRSIDGVPLGIAFTASVTSHIGHWATEAFETAFTDVNAAKFSKFGMAFPERAAEAVRNAGPVTPSVRTLLKEYVARCVSPEVADNSAKLRELMAATDIPTLMRSKDWVNPARFLMHEGQILYCTDAWAKLEEVIQAEEIPAQEKLLATKLAGTENDIIVAQVRQAIPESEALMYGISRTMTESLKHSLLLNAIPEGVRLTADRAGTPLAAAVQISKAQGNMASEISYRTMASLAASFLPKFRNILEFILIAASPFVFLTMVLMGLDGGKVFRMYFTLFFWLALWAPMAAVVNFLILHVDRQPMNLLIEQFGGVTLAGMDLIRAEGASSQAMAGYVMILIPMISYVIAKASDIGVTSLASSVMQPAQSAAAAQSSSLAMGNIAAGNVSAGNVSANNTAMNSWDTSLKQTDGARYVHSTAWGTTTRDLHTGELSGASTESVNLGMPVMSTMNNQASLQRNLSESSGYGHTEGVEFGNGTSLNHDQSTGTAQVVGADKTHNQVQRESEVSSHLMNVTEGLNKSVMFGDGEQAASTESLGMSTDYRLTVHSESEKNKNKNGTAIIEKPAEAINSAILDANNNAPVTERIAEAIQNTINQNQSNLTPNRRSGIGAGTIPDEPKAPINNIGTPTSSLNLAGNEKHSQKENTHFNALIDLFDPRLFGEKGVRVSGDATHAQSTNSNYSVGQSDGTMENYSHGTTIGHDQSTSANFHEGSELRQQNGVSLSNRETVTETSSNTSQHNVSTATNSSSSTSGGVTIGVDAQRTALLTAREFFPNMSDAEFLRVLSSPENRMAIAQQVNDRMEKNTLLNPANTMPSQQYRLEGAHKEFDRANSQVDLQKAVLDANWVYDHTKLEAGAPAPKELPDAQKHKLTPEEFNVAKMNLKDDLQNAKDVHKEYFEDIGTETTFEITHLGGYGYEPPEDLRNKQE